MGLEWVHYSTSHKISLSTQLHQLGKWDESHQHYHTTAIAVDRMVSRWMAEGSNSHNQALIQKFMRGVARSLRWRARKIFDHAHFWGLARAYLSTLQARCLSVCAL